MKLIIDLTDVGQFFRAHWTVSGIQRVTLRVAQTAASQYGRQHDISVLSIDEHGRAMIGDIKPFESGAAISRDVFEAAFPGEPEEQKQEKLVRALRHTPPKEWKPLLRRRFAGFLNPGEPGAPVKSLARAVSATDIDGATILSLGGVRPVRGYWDHIDRFRSMGLARMIMVIHDLIPLNRSELVPDDQPEIFYEALNRASEAANEFIAVSEHTAKDLARFHQTHGYTGKTINVVRLAHEFVEPIEEPPSPYLSRRRSHDASEQPTGIGFPAGAGLRRQVRALALEKYVMFVGTVEPRKNILSLCRVWRDIIKERGAGNTPRLVLAGKNAFGREELEEFLRISGHLDGHVVHVDAPSDRELAFLYDHCQFTVFPSKAEGWGLPVGESLWRGKLCVASHAWSVPEVGGDLCRYFDPEQPNDMKRVLMDTIADPSSVRNAEIAIRGARLRTWNDVCDDIWKVVSPGG